MKPLFSAALVLLLCESAFGVAPPLKVKVRERRPPIRDAAKLFSASEVERANRRIEDIRERFHIDLCVDTLKELPGEAAEKLRTLRRVRDKAAFLRKWAQERADDEGVDGIYVLVLTHPRDVVLIGWPARREGENVTLAQQGGLSGTKRETILRKGFARELGSNPDRALSRLVDRFSQAVESLAMVEPSPLETMPAGILVASMIGLWLLLFILRSTQAHREAVALGEPYRPIYHPAMLGSLFGAPAAFWVYDRLFQLERQPTKESVPPEQGPSPEGESSPGEASEPAEKSSLSASEPTDASAPL
jgi:hypothetical protein